MLDVPDVAWSTLSGTHDTIAYTNSLVVGQVLLRPFTPSWVCVGLEVRHGAKISIT